MKQRLQDTDFFILKEFEEACKPLVQVPCTPEVQAEMAKRGKPFLERLKRNGHSIQDCADLMYMTLGLKVRQVRPV